MRCTAQGFAQSAHLKMNLRKLCAVSAGLAVCTLISCTRPPAPVVASMSQNGVEADAVIPTASSWYVLRFNSPGYLHLPAVREAWNDSTFNAPQAWKEIASPGGAFRPVQAIAGIQGHFYLLDAAQGRLCLYDTGAQLLSTFPLPQALLPFVPGRMEVFRGADGAFTFLDYQAGEASQFADRQGSEGGTDWVLRGRIKLPMGIRDCIQEPGTEEVSCKLPDGPARFDASLNRIGAGHALPIKRRMRLFWDRDVMAWALEAFSSDSQSVSLFRFRPTQRRLETGAPLSP